MLRSCQSSVKNCFACIIYTNDDDEADDDDDVVGEEQKKFSIEIIFYYEMLQAGRYICMYVGTFLEI